MHLRYKKIGERLKINHLPIFKSDPFGINHIFLSSYIRYADIVGTIDVYRPDGDVLYYYFIFLCHISLQSYTFFSFLYYYSMQNLEMLRFQTYFFFFPIPSSLFLLPSYIFLPPYYIIKEPHDGGYNR